MQDFGYVEAGENYSCSVTMSTAAAAVVFAYWHNRVPVAVRDVAGLVIPNMRVVVKKFSYVDRFENFIQADIEFWRV